MSEEFATAQKKEISQTRGESLHFEGQMQSSHDTICALLHAVLILES